MLFNDYDHKADWRELLAQSITDAETLCATLKLDYAAIASVAEHFPIRINPYYFSLMQTPYDPIWLQAVPAVAELAVDNGSRDPLCEELQSPLPGLTHRYPDRVILLVSEQCAMYCRFCMRKRKTGCVGNVNLDGIEAGIKYIRAMPNIRDVILSGGDPLLQEDDFLETILKKIRAITHVEIIRIHTRIPCTLPQRITPELAAMLRRYQPLFINTHFNHPAELTAEATRACAILSDAGISLGCQSVLLKGVNDDPAIMRQLLTGLLKLRVRPYYLHHPDAVAGTGHFRPSVDKGLTIMQALRGYVSGMAVPQYMLDLPKGGGKVPILPTYAAGWEADTWKLRNFQGEIFDYPIDEGL